MSTEREQERAKESVLKIAESRRMAVQERGGGIWFVWDGPKEYHAERVGTDWQDAENRLIAATPEAAGRGDGLLERNLIAGLIHHLAGARALLSEAAEGTIRFTPDWVQRWNDLRFTSGCSINEARKLFLPAPPSGEQADARPMTEAEWSRAVLMPSEGLCGDPCPDNMGSICRNAIGHKGGHSNWQGMEWEYFTPPPSASPDFKTDTRKE